MRRAARPPRYDRGVERPGRRNQRRTVSVSLALNIQLSGRQACPRLAKTPTRTSGQCRSPRSTAAWRYSKLMASSPGLSRRSRSGWHGPDFAFRASLNVNDKTAMPEMGDGQSGGVFGLIHTHTKRGSPPAQRNTPLKVTAAYNYAVTRMSDQELRVGRKVA